MKKENKKLKFDIQLNSVSDFSPTKKECEFILHDFEVSHNNAVIPKDVAINSFDSLANMPIVCRYTPVSGAGENDDHLGGHEAYLNQDREDGTPFIATNTVPIGVFTEAAYLKTITDDFGKEIEVVCGKGVLWASRFPNEVGLLKEWLDEGTKVHSSMEILYDSYLFENGVETVLSYVYEGHCILNSEARGDQGVVYPAYDISKLNKLVAQIIEEEKSKEGEKELNLKKVFEISHSDVRAKLYNQLSQVLSEQEYQGAWITDVYDTHFVYEVWEENNGSKYYQMNYLKDNDNVTVSTDSKVEVVEKREWIKIDENLNLQTQLNEVTTQFNEAAEKLAQMTQEIAELQPIKEQFEREKDEARFDEIHNFYAAKFEAVKGKEKFETAEVQEILKKAIFENEVGLDAKNQLNIMLVDLVSVASIVHKKDEVREFASRRSNLMPENNDFDSRYAL
jgi:hypothetical protein